MCINAQYIKKDKEICKGAKFFQMMKRTRKNGLEQKFGYI